MLVLRRLRLERQAEPEEVPPPEQKKPKKAKVERVVAPAAVATVPPTPPATSTASSVMPLSSIPIPRGFFEMVEDFSVSDMHVG